MSVDKTYRCNLCGDALQTDFSTGPSRTPIGIWWQSWPKGWIEKPWLTMGDFQLDELKIERVLATTEELDAAARHAQLTI